MLFRENFRRGHEARLIATLYGNQHCEDRDRGLPRPDITLEHTIHPLRRYHVSMDLPKRSGLSPCQFEGQRFVQRANEVIGSTVPDPGPFFRRSSSSLRLNKLEEEELVERKATPATFGVVDRLGSMQPRQRLLERG